MGKRKQSWPKTDLAGEEWEEEGKLGGREKCDNEQLSVLGGEIRLVNFLIKQAADPAAPPASH